MLKRLILIPFGLAFAVLAALVTLVMFVVIVPELAQAVFGAMQALARGLFRLLELDHAPDAAVIVAEGAMARAGLLALAVLVAPVCLVALAAELFGWRGWMAQSALGGLLTIALPMALLSPARTLTGAETRIVLPLGLVGVVAASVYWLIAGRGAGRERPPPTLPASSSGS
jgi:hypothetical protein